MQCDGVLQRHRLMCPPCRRLQGPSKLIQVVLPRPMGVIFEEDARHKQAVVVGFVKGSIAEQKMKVHGNESACREQLCKPQEQSRARRRSASAEALLASAELSSLRLARLAHACLPTALHHGLCCLKLTCLFTPCHSLLCNALQVAKMNSSLLDACPREGDILRACTCTTFVSCHSLYIG